MLSNNPWMHGHLEGVERTPCKGSLKWNAFENTYNICNIKKSMMQIKQMPQNQSRRKKLNMFYMNCKNLTNTLKLMKRGQNGVDHHYTTYWSDIIWNLVLNAHGSTQK